MTIGDREEPRLTWRQRELSERPFCAGCGKRVYSATSQFINGWLWCPACQGQQQAHAAGRPQVEPPARRKRSKVKLTAKRRRLLSDSPSCAYCGCELVFETATVDHVVPRSKGGTNSIENLVLACVPCNRTKGDKMLEAIGPSGVISHRER